MTDGIEPRPTVASLTKRVLALEEDRWKEQRKAGMNGELLLRIDERQKKVLAQLEGLVPAVETIAKQQAACAAVQEERWQAHKVEHAQLNTRKNLGDAGAGIVGIVAAALAAVFGGNS